MIRSRSEIQKLRDYNRARAHTRSAIISLDVCGGSNNLRLLGIKNNETRRMMAPLSSMLTLGLFELESVDLGPSKVY